MKNPFKKSKNLELAAHIHFDAEPLEGSVDEDGAYDAKTMVEVSGRADILAQVLGKGIKSLLEHQSIDSRELFLYELSKVMVPFIIESMKNEIKDDDEEEMAE